MSFKIAEMPDGERPRERLARLGSPALRDAELIAILLRTGIQGKSAVALAEELLHRYGGLNGIAQAQVADLAKVKGLGTTKAVQLKAAFEIGVRIGRATSLARPLDSPETIYTLLGDELANLPHEVCRVILINSRHHHIATEEISKGTVNLLVCEPRDILTPALTRQAYGLILVHNHPSGDPTPSEADNRLTERLQRAADLLGVFIADHIIIGRRSDLYPAGWFSYRAANLLS